MLVVVDFGSQTTHLIARRLRDLGQSAEIVTPENALEFVEKNKPDGIILSGGPSSVYAVGAPTIDEEIFNTKIPMLAICYGFQITAHLLGGKVVSGKKEYGPSQLELRIMNQELSIIKGLPKRSVVWMSHGDEIVKLPKGFIEIGSTEHVPFAFSINKEKKIYGVLFHPEVEHTEQGIKILQNFLNVIASGTKQSRSKSEIAMSPTTPRNDEISFMIERIRQQVGGSHVIAAVSGGVDSTVAGVLVAKAVGKQFTPIFVDNGLMRDGASDILQNVFKPYGVKPIIMHVEEEMLKRLKGITDPEEKRKIIGKFYIEIFEKEMQKLLKKDTDVKFLMQGTIYSDVIESQGTKHADKIKSHHNVGGLPKDMKLQLLEPLRNLYKDEVRALGEKLGLSREIVWRQAFPGPGFAIRIRGEVTEKRLKQEKKADTIVLEELRQSGWLEKVYMSFAIMTGAESVAVKGDGRFFGEVIALRIVESKDIMTSTWARIPYDTLQRISSRIVNEVPDISRVVYDISTKPPATMEWE